jgi:GT2 family glycosyltransferase
MNSSNEKKLAIVIPVFNNFQYTNNTLNSLSKLPSSHIIILVDNNSTDNTKLLNSTDKIKIIRNNINLGFGKACNQGFILSKELGYENIMFLNNDIKIIDKENCWTNDIISECKKGLIVGPTIGCLDNNFQFICESSKFPSRGFWYMSGWCISASANIWDKLIIQNEEGPFFTKFFAYFEDTDLSFRAKILGIHFLIINIPVKHIGRVTGKKLNLGDMYLKSRNIFIQLWSNRKSELA